MEKDKNNELDIDKIIRKRTLVSISVFLVLITAGYFGWRYLYQLPQTTTEGAGIRKPVRAGLEVNERVFSKIFSHNHLTKTYPPSDALLVPRVNGSLGLVNPDDTLGWQLKVVKASGDTLSLRLSDIKALPKTEIAFDFKCIEGWSQITHWGGVRFRDFVRYYNLDKECAMKYVGLVTPDKGYYVGLDMPSALHPQTLLCYEMNGKPLTLKHGYPLRLIIPVKYGIKSLKRIGTLSFSNTRPPDYWAERGYDYYSGL